MARISRATPKKKIQAGRGARVGSARPKRNAVRAGKVTKLSRARVAGKVAGRLARGLGAAGVVASAVPLIMRAGKYTSKRGGRKTPIGRPKKASATGRRKK